MQSFEPVETNPVQHEKRGYVEADDVLDFLLSYLYPKKDLPRFRLYIRDGIDCQPGPPLTYPLAFDPEQGHKIGLELPFLEEKKVPYGKLEILFHEWIHMLHFASVEDEFIRFPSELAPSDLLYEAEALAFQKILMSLYTETEIQRDFTGIKDLIYVAETERQLYEGDFSNADDMISFLEERIKLHYPAGDCIRGPISASHLIRPQSSAKYWIYPAAAWKTLQRMGIMHKQGIEAPEYWKQGNLIAYTNPEMNLPEIKQSELSLLSAKKFSFADLPHRDFKEIRKERLACGISLSR